MGHCSTARRALITAGAIFTAYCILPTAYSQGADHAPLPRFDRIVIDGDFPGAYQVEVAEVNGDGKPDIIALGGGTVAWYENPSWKKRIITGSDKTPGVISTAARDLDGDGKAEVAIAYDFAMNTPTKGELLLAIQGTTSDDPWTLRPIGHFGSIHRLRWGDIDNDGRIDLIVAPIFGESAKPPTYDQDPAKLVALRTLAEIQTAADWHWESWPLAERPVIHAIEVLAPVPPIKPGEKHGETLIFAANNLGVAAIAHDPEMAINNDRGLIVATLFPGASGPAPARGSSEVHRGRLRRGDSELSSGFTATIEPWHGNEVVIWRTSRTKAPGDVRTAARQSRTVIDDTLDDGHALWVTDVDGDGDDEIFAGHRGKDHRVSAYNFNGKTWDRTILDRDIAAQDLRGGDLDGDGTTDLVAVGGFTHNVVWYRPVREEAKKP